MKRSNKLRSHNKRQPRFTCALALLLALALLIVSCSKNSNNTASTTSSGNTSTGSTGNSNKGELKGEANKQGEATEPDKGDFLVKYTPVTSGNQKYIQMNENLQREHALEQIADELNAALSMPEDVTITFRECGEINAKWQPQDRSINMCFELIEYFAETFKDDVKNEQELENAIAGATTFTFFHELGHCLVDVMQLPSTGKEEDAVDQLSTYILVDTGGEEGSRMVLIGAMWFWKGFQKTQQAGVPLEKLYWADEHSMDGARAYNILCWVFGSNPQKYQGLINNPLPESRAVRCPQEYARLSTAWLKLLKPYLKDAGRKALEGNPEAGAQAPTGQPEGGDDEDEHGGH